MRSLLTAIAALAIATPAWAANDNRAALEKAHLATIVVLAFQCATYAGHADRPEERERLFELGLKAGRDFYKAVLNNEIPLETIQEETPLTFQLTFRGPTADFATGRMYDYITTQAFLELSGEKSDKDRKVKASILYSNEHCNILK